jgi:hypothetical protein
LALGYSPGKQSGGSIVHPHSRISGMQSMQISQGKNQVTVAFTLRLETRWPFRSRPVFNFRDDSRLFLGKVRPRRSERDTFVGIASIQTPKSLFWLHRIKFAKFFFELP